MGRASQFCKEGSSSEIQPGLCLPMTMAVALLEPPRTLHVSDRATRVHPTGTESKG